MLHEDREKLTLDDMPASFHRVLRTYGVTAELYREPPGQLDARPAKGTPGPRGHFCQPKARVVTIEARYYHPEDPETIFHEAMHVITQPPFWHITDVHEDFVLMQFERSLSRRVHTPEVHARLVQWQEDTVSGITDEFLSRNALYRRSNYWRDGFAIARAVGLLDVCNEPTWCLADWDVLPQKTWEVVRDVHKGVARGSVRGLLRQARSPNRVKVLQ